MECVVCKDKTWGIEALQCVTCQRWTHNDHSQTALHRFYTVKYGSSSSYNCRDCTSKLMSERDVNPSLESTSSKTMASETISSETTSSETTLSETTSPETLSSSVESSMININNTPFVILHQGRKSRMSDLPSQQSLKDTKEKYSNLKEVEFIKSKNTYHLKSKEMDQNKVLLSNFSSLSSRGNELQYVQKQESNKLPNSKIDHGILNATHTRRKQRRSPPYLPSWSDTPKVVSKSKAQNRTLFSDSIFDRAIKQKLKMPPVAIEYVNLEETEDNFENHVKNNYSDEINHPIEKVHNVLNTHISSNLVDIDNDTKNAHNSSISYTNNCDKITKNSLTKNLINISSIDISSSLGIPGPVYIEEYVPPSTSRSPQKNKKVLNVSPEVGGLYQMMNALGVENGLSKIINSLEVDKLHSEINTKSSNNDINMNIKSHDNIESRKECSRSFNPEEHLSQLKEMDSCFGNTFLLNKCKKYCKEYLTILNGFPYRPLWDPVKGSAATNAMWLQHGDIPLNKCIDIPVEPTPTVRSAMKITFENQIDHDDYVEQKINILSHLYTRRLQYNRKLKQENETWVRKGQEEFIPNYQEMQMAANIAFFTLHNLCKIKLEIAKFAEIVFREKDEATYSYIIYRSKSKAFMKKVIKDLN